MADGAESGVAEAGALYSAGGVCKEIAVHSQSGVWGAITYYLAVALFVSGCYNLFFYLRTQKKRGFKQFAADVFNRRTVWPGIYMVAFSAALITAKAGFSMIFFLLLLILLVNGDYGITD